jgi:hypothetical protein
VAISVVGAGKPYPVIASAARRSRLSLLVRRKERLLRKLATPQRGFDSHFVIASAALRSRFFAQEKKEKERLLRASQ